MPSAYRYGYIGGAASVSCCLPAPQAQQTDPPRHVSWNLVDYERILVRATNWVGDAVMSLPALRALRGRFPRARISILAKPWVADLYRREPFCDEIILYTAPELGAKGRGGGDPPRHNFDCAILLQNAFEAAAIAWV